MLLGPPFGAQLPHEVGSLWVPRKSQKEQPPQNNVKHRSRNVDFSTQNGPAAVHRPLKSFSLSKIRPNSGLKTSFGGLGSGRQFPTNVWTDFTRQRSPVKVSIPTQGRKKGM